jgi:tetratricopeptide (TPR) repeat protein
MSPRCLTVSLLPPLFGLLAGCQDPPEGGPAQSQPAPVSRPCQAGYSVDPPRADARPAERLVKEQKYSEARKSFDALLAKYPDSSNLRVWRGDADLFDEKADYLGSANRALAFYTEARKLDGLGCKLSAPERYYGALHIAFTHLRKGDAPSAKNELHALEREYPESAEVQYNLARSECLAGDGDRCYHHFEQALALAHARSRPKFLRTHYSVADWIRRSETQSELGPLRKDPRYRALVKRMANEE